MHVSIRVTTHRSEWERSIKITAFSPLVFLKFLPTISSLDFQQDAATRCLLYQTKPFHINSIYFEQVNTPPSTRLHLGWYQFMYVISHIYYFVMLLINLKFCMMRFLNEVIPLILMLPSWGYPSKTF